MIFRKKLRRDRLVSSFAELPQCLVAMEVCASAHHWARLVLAVSADNLQMLQAKIAVLDREIAARAKANPTVKRLMTIPGVGPIAATAGIRLSCT